MLVKIESCVINKILGNIAKVAFLGNVPSNSEADIIKEEYNSELFKLNQIHSNCVIMLDDNTNLADNIEGDAIVTKNSGIIIGILTADCVPVIFVDIKNHIIAVAHAGWRGARYGIIENTINSILKLSSASKPIAIVGPCIHQANYEVKQDFVDNFMSEHNGNNIFFKVANQKTFFDLPSYVKHKLKKNNISRLYDIEIDTFSSKAFASYRREKIKKKYSNLSVVMLNNSPENDQQDVFTTLLKQKHNIEMLKHNRSFSKFIDTDNTDVKFKFSKEAGLISPKENKQILKNIKSGKVIITNKLDLHGYDILNAFSVLEKFILDNFDNNSRYLLVITGKGRNGNSILRTSFVNWVENNNNLNKYILTYIESLPEHGGSGAFYLVLRKNKVDFY